MMASTGKRVQVTMSMDTAKKEGWTSNKKYQSMPEQMLRYRSATALIRLYCPEVMVGIPSVVEIETTPDTGMRDVTPHSEAANAALASITGGNEPDPAPLTQPEPVKAKPAARSRVKDEADDVTDDAPEEDVAPKKVNRTPPAPAKVEKPEPVVEPEPEQEAAGISAGDDERPEPDADVPLKIKNMAAAIFKDIEASGSPDAVAEFYADQIEEIRKAAPALYATLDAAFKAANAA